MQSRRTKRRFPLPLALAIVSLIILIIVVSIFSLTKRSTSAGYIDRAVRLGATLSQQVTPFGEDVIYYDGVALHCVNTNGSSRWVYTIGSNANFHASNSRIVAWSGSQVSILNSKGKSSYNNALTAEVQFARTGSQFVAVFTGEADNGTISVINTEGQNIDSIAVEDMTVLDMGFFNASTTQSAGSVELLWVLGLDTSGTVLSTILKTYQPGKLSTGNTTLGEQIAYKVFYYDGYLRVVDTRKIASYDYKIKQDSSTPEDVLIYGWYMQDVKTVGKTTYQLFVPAPELDGSLAASDLRIKTGSSDTVVHLPVECISAYLGSNAVYGFSNTHVYMCYYGSNVFTTYTLPVQITGVTGMLSGNNAVVSSGADVSVIKLPN